MRDTRKSGELRRPLYRDVLLVAVVTAVVPDAGETAIISDIDNQRPTFRTGTSVGEPPTAEPEN
jgi:hypothetical protein